MQKFALFNPNTGVLNPFELTIALGEHAVLNGAKVLLNTEVTGINTEDGKVVSVETTQGTIETKIVINAAGLFSDKVAGMVEHVDYTVKPRKGVYFLYDKQYGDFIKRPIYSAPTAVSKGLIMLPTTEGNILCGSNAILHDDKEDLSTDLESLNHIYQKQFTNIIQNFRVWEMLQQFLQETELYRIQKILLSDIQKLFGE